jgi:hypothetical protein
MQSADCITTDGKPLTYLDFQQIVTSDAFVVHFIVGIVGITAALILNESEAIVEVKGLRKQHRMRLDLQSA